MQLAVEDMKMLLGTKSKLRRQLIIKLLFPDFYLTERSRCKVPVCNAQLTSKF
jgi:hypothetical protein